MPIKFVRLREFNELEPPICSKVTPDDKTRMRRLIQKTQEDGRERGYVKCDNGDITQVCTGAECTRRGANIQLKGCPSPHRDDITFHTHPWNSQTEPFDVGTRKAFSITDLRVDATVKTGGCIGYVDDHRMAMRCVRSTNIDPYDLRMAKINIDYIARELRRSIAESPGQGTELARQANKAVVEEMNILHKKFGVCEIDLGALEEGNDGMTLDHWLS